MASEPCLLCGAPGDANYSGCYVCDRKTAEERERMEKYAGLLGGPRAWEQFHFERFKSDTEGAKKALAAAVGFDLSKNLYLHGPTGTGKSHLAVAAGRRWLRKVSVYTLKPAMLSREVRGVRSAIGEHEIMERYANAGVLILDDIGVAKDTEFSTALLYELIDGRYMNKPGGLIVTSNLSLDELAAKLGDDRIPSRLAQMCRGNIVNMAGEPDRRVAK